MTPAEMLAPQLPTVPGEDKRAVWQLITDDLSAGRYDGQFHRPIAILGVVDLARERDKQGEAKYSHRLPVDSGRESRLDELQEALDGLAYSRQTYEQEAKVAGNMLNTLTAMRRADGLARRAWARHLRCLKTVLELLEELGEVTP